MNEIQQIKDNVEKISMLSEVYNEISRREVYSDEELEIAKAKLKVAKEEMLKLMYKTHKLVEKTKARL